MKMQCDNQAAIFIANDLNVHMSIKNVEVDSKCINIRSFSILPLLLYLFLEDLPDIFIKKSQDQVL